MKLITSSHHTVIALTLLIYACISSAYGLEKRVEKIGNHQFVTVVVHLKKDILKQYWKDKETGQAYGSFAALASSLKKKQETLVFAINSGIFAKNHTPLGLYIEEGQILQALNQVEPKNAKGNFSLMPNGVFILEENKAFVLTTQEYLRQQNRFKPKYATQSGPMLLIGHQYHPRFIKGSDSVKIRAGVCAKEETVYFVISKTWINFYDFAAYFKDRLQCSQALYLDGTLTQLYYEGQYYGAPFWKVREYVGMWGVTRKNEL